MVRKTSTTKQHILDIAASILINEGGSDLKIADLAVLSNVGVPTIYYHFTSKAQLIAQAQASNYYQIVMPLHHYLSMAESALAEQDEAAFWDAIGENMVMAWTSGRPEDSWSVVRLLLDVWSDTKTRLEFCENLDRQLDRWAAIVEQAKERGWVDPTVDTDSLIASFWSATIGQAILSSSSRIEISPDRIRDFFYRAMGATTLTQEIVSPD